MPSAILQYEIDHEKMFSLSQRTSTSPATLTLDAQKLVNDSSRLNKPIENTRHESTGLVEFIPAMYPEDSPKVNRWKIAIGRQWFQVDRKAAKALCAWIPFYRPFAATRSKYYLALMATVIFAALAIRDIHVYM